MATFRFSLDAEPPPVCRGGIVTIGNFDGVHRGHQTLLAEAVRQARSLGCPAIAVTFDPHPLQLLRPEAFQPVLTTVDYRARLMQDYRADHVLILQTTPALLRLGARDFFDRILRTGLDAGGMVEGYNFAFGHEREGTTAVLQALCREAGVALTLIAPHAVLGKPVSSSRVRNEILAGNAIVVRELLGRPYRIAGVVGTGQRRGQSLGFPTANLDHITTLVPGNGVYAVRAHHRGTAWPGAANVGPNPTFGENARKIEVHLLGFKGDLYGQELEVDFIEKIRDTRPFASVPELVTQVRADVERVKAILS